MNKNEIETYYRMLCGNVWEDLTELEVREIFNSGDYKKLPYEVTMIIIGCIKGDLLERDSTIDRSLTDTYYQISTEDIIGDGSLIYRTEEEILYAQLDGRSYNKPIGTDVNFLDLDKDKYIDLYKRYFNHHLVIKEYKDKEKEAWEKSIIKAVKYVMDDIIGYEESKAIINQFLEEVNT